MAYVIIPRMSAFSQSVYFTLTCKVDYFTTHIVMTAFVSCVIENGPCNTFEDSSSDRRSAGIGFICKCIEETTNHNAHLSIAKY